MKTITRRFGREELVSRIHAGSLLRLNDLSRRRAGQKAITDEATLSKIMEGETTKAQVEALLGKPAAVDFEGDQEKWVYTYYHSPSHSGFGPNPETKVHTLTLLFDPSGIVKKVGRGETATRVQ